MANAVDICNMALANLGDTADITSLNPPEGSMQAERCAQFFPVAVNALLEMHEWNFATKRQALAAYSENDRGDWEYKYALPAKLLKVIDINFEDTFQLPPEMAKRLYDYEISVDTNGNKCLYTNIENATIRYVSEVEPVMFPTLFTIALAWKMSSILAGALIKGNEGIKMTQSCEQMAMQYLLQAISHDARQHQEYREQIPEWIRGR